MASRFDRAVDPGHRQHGGSGEEDVTVGSSIGRPATGTNGTTPGRRSNAPRRPRGLCHPGGDDVVTRG